MHRLTSTLSASALTMLAAVALASPAAATAAPKAPSPNASCIGRTFVPQATGAPGAIADRIAFIKDNLLLEGESFGNVIGGWFAHSEDC
jgi:hypothetical protein